MTFDGKAVQTSSADLAAGRKDGPLVDLRFEVEATTRRAAVGAGRAAGRRASALKTSVEGDLMGGARYEQLFRATGSVRVAGDEHPFTGSGLRIRRQGVRRLEGFWGHCWQSALFPSGRAFGYIAYPPRPDGQPTFNEGYVFSTVDGDLIPARVVEAPWLSRLQPRARTSRSCWRPPTAPSGSRARRCCRPTTSPTPARFPPELLAKMANWTFPALQQAGVRYRWNGEETIRHARALESDGQDHSLGSRFVYL